MPVLEFSALEDYVVLRKTEDASPWLAQGFTPVEPGFIAFHSAFAVHKVEREKLDRLLFELTLEPVPRDAETFALEERLAEALSPHRFMMLRRPIKRPGSPYEIPALGEPLGPPRLDTEHYVLVEAVDEDGAPVGGVRLELVIAGGEVRRSITDKDGIARVERIQAGRVVIRVLSMDGSMWWPEAGDGSQPSGSDSGSWHVLKISESLSRVAHQHGLRDWKAVWEDPKNEPLRKRRKSPINVRPGDDVHVPGVRVHEIVRETDASHGIVVARARERLGNVVSGPDLRFHPGSCVFLGECSDVTDPRGLAGASGVDALATALLYARDNPAHKLLIAGHADASGDPEQNERLSERRALALQHLLLGKRDAWVKLVERHSTIADYQQILAWFSIVRGWPCAPFEVNGAPQPDNERILQAFQTAYNRHFGTEIDEDGVIGPQTWAAIFDVYRVQLAHRLETDAAGLRQLCARVQFCSSKQAHGCGSALAFRSGAAEQDAPAYRRVELMFFEPDGEPTASDLEQGPPAPPDFVLAEVPVERGAALVWISLQTVDELGHRLPNVNLAFRSGDHVSHHTTDSRGLWHGQVRTQGVIEVSTADGAALGLGPGSAFGKCVELSPRWAAMAITDLVVQGAVDPALLEAHTQHVARYDAAPEGALRTLRTGPPVGASSTREPMEQPTLSGEGTLPTRRAIRARAADNLFMAAELDFGKMAEVLDLWLQDYFPEVHFRGYLLELIVGHRLAVFDSSGEAQHLFDLAPDVELRGGRTGLHALIETGRERDANSAMFLDLAQERTVIDIGRRGIDGYQPSVPGSLQDGKIDVVRVAEIVAPRDRNDYLNVLWGAQARGAWRLAYLWRSDSAWIAANGGTGVLEPYPKDPTLRAHIHSRNKAVIASMKRAYGAYIDDFIAMVRAIHADPEVAQEEGKKHPELQLYELLPPWPTPEIPAPVGIDGRELMDLQRDDSGSSEFMAWKAITEKHNEIWEVRTAGSMWLATEFSTSLGFDEEVGGGGKLALKLNFEVSTDHNTDAIEVKPSAKRTIFLKRLELDSETGVVKGTLKNEKLLGPFEVEADSTGKLTLKYGKAKASYERGKKQLGVGLGGSISLRRLVTEGLKLRGKEWPDHGEPAWLEKLPDLKAEVSLSYQLSRPSDILAVVSNAPGLVALGSRKRFMEADWGSLWAEQREALKVLGWDADRWDKKRLPASATMHYDELSAEEKMAAAKLPVPKEADWTDFWVDFRDR